MKESVELLSKVKGKERKGKERKVHYIVRSKYIANYVEFLVEN
jgi:hypothetical protein